MADDLPVFSSFAWLYTLICMAETTGNPLELILQLCGAAAPNPWYPSTYAQAAGIARDSLDPHLERLRLAGLVRLTDWMPGTGQGYALTPAGRDLLSNPRGMSLLRAGNLHLESTPQPVEPLLEDAVTKRFARSDAVTAVFTINKTPVVTFVLIFANLVVFAYGWVLAKQAGLSLETYLGTSTVLGGQRIDPRLADVYVAEGSLQPRNLAQGEWWRLITSCFVHLGLIHLGSNLLSLYFVGPLVERMWGSVRFLIIYMLAGFGGACSMAYFNGAGAGASGAIWGVMTSMVTWLLLNRSHMPRPFLNNMLRRLFNVFLLNVFISLAPGISAAAHFGGGAAGVVASILMHGNLHGRAIVKIASAIGAVLMPFVCFGAMYTVQRSNPNWELLDLELRRKGSMNAARDDGIAIYNGKLLPLLKRGPQGLSEQELRQAVEVQKEIVKALQAAIDLGQQGPTYRSPQVEQERRKAVETLQNKVGLVERNTWQVLFNPAARDEIRQAMRVFREQAKPLLDGQPATRSKEELEKAQANLQEQITKLAGMHELLETLGPLQSDPGLEESRKEEMGDLAFYQDLLKSAATGLSQGSNWPDESRRHFEKLLDQLKKR